MERTRTKVLIPIMRPNRKGNRGPRMVRRTKNTKNRDHRFLLEQREKGRVKDDMGRTRAIHANGWQFLDF